MYNFYSLAEIDELSVKLQLALSSLHYESLKIVRVPVSHFLEQLIEHCIFVSRNNCTTEFQIA